MMKASMMAAVEVEVQVSASKYTVSDENVSILFACYKCISPEYGEH